VAGLAAHSFLPLDAPITASFALIFAATAHASGWPLPRGGSQKIADALATALRALGGEILTGSRIERLDQLGAPRAVLFDTSPAALDRIAGDRLPESYRRRLRRFRRGPGIFKLDYALSGPVPWRAPECRRAGTVHLGGTFEEIAASEAAVARGAHPEKPFVLVAQQSLFDPTRAPPGKHTLWAYCHVPNGSTEDMTARIEAQLERFAPGFKDLVLARTPMSSRDVEAHNANYVGGDISGGAHDGLQFFARPRLALDPYATPARDLYLCSSSTPPGGGVHGMCGYHAARSALRRSF
jgi:phytoene dehydrogenase-like protein